MPAKPIPWEWTNQREEAARHVADDILPNREIAARVGINDTTLYYWCQRSEFMERVNKLVADYRARIRRSGIAVIENRVARLQDIERRMARLIEARASAYANPEIPGGDTGLVVEEIKGIGSGEAFRTVYEYKTDAALLRELREYNKQVSQELGQWAEAGNEGRNQALDFLKVLDQQMKAGPAKTEDGEGAKQDVPD